MTAIDFKSEAVAFVQKHGCPPASVIQAAMERGAELAIGRVVTELKSVNAYADEQRRISNGGDPYGQRNGTLAV